MKPSMISALAGLFLLCAAVPAWSYEVGLRYYRIQDSDLAESIDQLDDQYDEREKPLKQQRRDAAYNTPEHAQATARLDSLHEERDREFLRLLENAAPEVDYSVPIGEGQSKSESQTINGKVLTIDLRLGKKDGDKVALEISAEYDGATLYKGSELLIPIATPYLVAKAFLKIQDRQQGTMVFVEVRP